MKITLSVAVALSFLCLTEFSCKDSGSPLGRKTLVPGKTGNAQAFGNMEGETSLVTLLFLESGEAKCLSVVDLTSGKAIPFRSSVWEGRPVVTLELAKGQFANPRLTFSGDVSFTALLTPEQSLLTFNGLSFGNHTMALRDHGVEIELTADIEKVFSLSEFTDLWLGDRLAKAVRVRFMSETAGDYDPVLEPESGAVVRIDKSQLRIIGETLEMGDHESASLVVAPPTDAVTIYFSVVAR